jgi:hypothetical protein
MDTKTMPREMACKKPKPQRAKGVQRWPVMTAHQLMQRQDGGCFAQPACAPQTMHHTGSED